MESPPILKRLRPGASAGILQQTRLEPEVRFYSRVQKGFKGLGFREKRDQCIILFREFCRDPLPHSLLNTSKSRVSGFSAIDIFPEFQVSF